MLEVSFDNFINHHGNGAITVKAHLAFCLKAVESGGGGMSVRAAAWPTNNQAQPQDFW